MATATGDGDREGPQRSYALRDRWLIWPSFTVLAGVLSLLFLCELPGVVSFLLIPLVLVGGPVAALALLVAAVVLAIRGKFRKAASILAAVLLPKLLWQPIWWAADCLHLGLTIGLGFGQIGLPSVEEAGRFAVYDWSVGLITSPNIFLIHDMTDEIGLPLADYKNPRASETEMRKYCAANVRHLLGHYYICTF